MRILYVAMKYDYGLPARGFSFEHYNFFQSLEAMGHDILYFDFMTCHSQHGRTHTNARLEEVANSERPDLLFAVLYQDQLDRNTLRRISEQGQCITLNWFCDDHWRFESFSRFWAPCFHWVVTTAQSALPKYAQLGYANVIKSQWACNHHVYRKLHLPLKYDVTFVGQPHGNRRQLLDNLRRAGIFVQAWGTGWEHGRLSQEQMIKVFNQSRINLNLSNASTTGQGVLARCRERAVAAVRKVASWLSSSPPQASSSNLVEQIKGRNFEVPGCGGFLLSGNAENLEEYYARDKEVAVFEAEEDLVEKIRHYLNHEEERQGVAAQGYARTLGDHTYEHRFREIFQRIGLTRDAQDQAAPGNKRRGTIIEVP